MTQTKYNKNWIAVIPAFILYDTKLSDKDKIVYSVISNLTHEKGYCWASNKYIADLLGCSPLTISRSVSNLNKLGHIKNTVSRTADGTDRKIILSISTNGIFKKDTPPIKKRLHNNITNNITDNKTNSSNELLTWFNNEFKRSFKVIDHKKLKMRLKTFGLEQIKTAIKNAYSDEFHAKNNFKYLTPTYFLRSDENVDKWLNTTKQIKNEGIKKTRTREYTDNIAKEFGW